MIDEKTIARKLELHDIALNISNNQYCVTYFDSKKDEHNLYFDTLEELNKFYKRFNEWMTN